jgi:hypothetical protein
MIVGIEGLLIFGLVRYLRLARDKGREGRLSCALPDR